MYFIFWILSICYVRYANGLTVNGNHVIKNYYYYNDKYTVSCSFWSWGRCTRYRNVRAYTLGCAAGWWSILEFLFPGCDYAICDGKTLFTGACNKYYSNDYQKTRNNGIVRSSGGTCSSPDTCTNCNDGFYSNGPYCEMCGPIANCNHRRCTSGSNQECFWCDGEVMYSPYWRAYTRHLDMKKCQKACSWRSDSTRCYPGTCSNELAANCQCAANFGGTHCENILDTPAIEYNHCKFTDDQGINIVENDPNYVQQSHPIVWTNFLGYTKMKTSMVAKYIQPADNRDADSYITGFRVGVIEQRTTMNYYSAGSVTPSVKTLTCPGMHRDQPVDFQTCPMDFSIWNGMGHDDKIMYEVSSTNGGYVDVANRENGRTTRYYYQGQTLTRTFEYHWDVVNPYHCSVTAGKSCTHFISIPSDITNNPIMTFSWDGWSDDLAGILYYEYQVFDLEKDGTQLVDGRVPVANAGNKPINDTLQDTFTLTTAGVYSIHLSVFDKAGNYKTGRGIFMFDDISVVDKTGDETKCATASKDTLYEWVVQDTNTVQIVWPDRFINVRHLNNGWLYGVQTFAPQPDISLYEDLYGNRTNAAIKNKRGIVDFKVSFEVHDPSLKDSRPLTSVVEIYNQYEYLTLNWADGDRLTVTVKALDVIHESKNDTIIVYRDATPPIIQNLWLTLGDRLNVTVHRIEEFTKMTIEWEAFDLHSGLDSVNWKLYDNYGGAVILHGHEHIIAQGNSENLTACQDNYGSRPRGANCYCTAFMGCYHRHFHVIPEIKTTSGLFTNKDRGVHDSDYFIEVNVTNKAKLTTVLTRKITVDISPPHAGAVHDGLVGNPEVDYQQGMNLNAYWDQFFDRESGVFFYQYLVGTSCAEKNDFSLNLTASNVTETYNNFGSYTAEGDGTYYFTVVAYNRALDPSEPVCSDGVTIDSSVPGVKEVTVKDAVITGGLITDINQTNYYILSSQRVRRMITNVTADCMMKATILTDIDLFPLEQYDNGSLPMVNGDVFCINSTGSPSSIGLTLSKSSLMEFSWKPIDIPAQVYDYELGFSSSPGSMAPDIMAFESTNQHAHHRVTHGNVPDGTEFYIIIKTISKSNVEGISTLGPCFIDTTSPDFSGSISVSLSGDILIAVWNLNGFSDSEELFEMDYQFAIGSRAYGTDIQSYQPIRGGGTCTITVPPTCTATNIHELDWYLHGFHTYYVSIKATNSAGQANIQTSSPYIHAVEPPTEGVVIDIDTQSDLDKIPLTDIEDVDFQKDTNSLAARWSGFTHPHVQIAYSISIGTTKGGNDIISMKNVGDTLSHIEMGLSLISYQKYYISVTAVSDGGNTTVSSDGVTVVIENDVLPGVVIYDGEPCNSTGFTLNHHENDNRMVCLVDRNFQMSLNSLKAYWSVPLTMQTYTSDAYIAIEKRSDVGNQWTIFQDFVHLSTMYDVSIDDLTLSPGVMYRIALKLCAHTICFQTIRSDGVMVIASPPDVGSLNVEHRNTTQTGGAEKLVVTFGKFFDPDMVDAVEKFDAISGYEYAITDNSVLGKPYMIWKSLVTYTETTDTISFEIILDGTMDFSKCKKLTVRGYNKVSLYSTVSTDIKDCKAQNPTFIDPNIVIDAVGAPDALDGIGRPIFLEKNAYWTLADEDYTPYKNLISAVWPTLRHRNYNYAIINARTVDVTTYYKQISQLELVDPCSHPDAIKCGHTDREFINEQFTNNELVHGTRYTVCIYAPPTSIQRTAWLEELVEVTACSDGIIVDLTPPVAGNVWIGFNPAFTYQTSNTDMFINWDGFNDVEEFKTGPHASGIKEYILAIGTTAGGNDVHDFENVGIVQHKALHKMVLQNGYSYYATIQASDFANRVTTVISDPIIIDSTSPLATNSPITIENRHIISNTEINACWKDIFTDLESGINYYLWSIGSEPGYTDMMDYVKVIDDECGMTDMNNPLDLLEGHLYYINVRAFNKAGLSTLITSWSFEVDTTPPTSGHVYDGDKSALTGDLKDIDYQIETEVLHSYWEGFHDSHSTIKEYYVSIGTCPQCEDILAEQAVGIVYEFILQYLHLGAGMRYYTTVTACNTADMCTTVTSDGVIIDNSPPLAGAVQDGTGIYDTEYQSMTTYLSAKWYGFDDPQSGLEKYEWRAGTRKGGDDVVKTMEFHITQTAAIYNTSLGLPINERIFVTIRAYNKAGMWSESSSNGFLVDTTPPVFKTTPVFSEDFGIFGLSQIYRTSMKIEWDIEDTESFIQRQYVSIKSHIGGEFLLSSHSINGIARSYVFNGLDLHDGVTYYVTVISCNGADICTDAISPGMFVDSTPPSRGMFAITTDHASDPELARHSAGWMTWTSHAVYLAWLGFSDVHSGIDHYMVTVGSTYMGKDLSKDISTINIHTDTNTDHGDEGKVQLFTVETSNIANLDTIFITVWAVNKVGLRSHLIHSAFTISPGGALDLIRRCEAMSCEGHCICAPQDQQCPYSASLGSCNDISSTVFNNTHYSLLLVRDTNGYSESDQAVTASNNVLRGMWILSQVLTFKPLWYEWSVGHSEFSIPLGIYDIQDEKVWQDAGQLHDAIFTIEQGGEYLHNTLSYAVFVRVWYSVNTYAIFKSNGIYVMTQAPVVASVRGRSVIERVQGTTFKDHDFMKMGRPITFEWTGKFLEAEATIEMYQLYLSTFPGGHDIMKVNEVIPGTESGYNMSRIILTPGVIHYANVIAYNYAGAHTTSSSDGFMIDYNHPTAGIVYDGQGKYDLEYQNSSDIIAAHWHGFIDTESGITSYQWCVGLTTFIGNSPTKTECSILSWTNVGLHVSASRNLSSSIASGTKLYHKVYAVDGVGWTSSTIVSDGVTVDTTPPVPDQFVLLGINLVFNPSFEITGGNDVPWLNISSTDICNMDVTYHPLMWNIETYSCMTVVSSNVNLAKDGGKFLYIRGSITQKIDNITEGMTYKVTFYSSHLSSVDSSLGNKEGFIQLNNEKHVFLIYTKSYRQDSNGDVDDREELSWHSHTFYFTADLNEANITIGSIDLTTGIFLDDITVQEVNVSTGDISGHVLGHVVYLHDWSSIHGAWSFTDPESSIIDYKWAIGYAEGGTQIQPFRSAGLMNFGINSNVTLVHNTNIYITTVAMNAAGLRGVSFSDPVYVDLTPPEINYVYDGRGEDEDAWTLNEVAANWAFEDVESGIKHCEWAIGYTPEATDLLPYTDVTTNTAYMDFPYSVLENHTIYTTLHCENNAGLLSSKSSDGVKISNRPPLSNSAVVEIMPISSTEFSADEGFLGVSDNARLKWSGYTDSIGIETYDVEFDNNKEKMFFPKSQEVLYSHFTKLSLADEQQQFSVRAINTLFLKSTIVQKNISIFTENPQVTSTPLTLSWINNEVVVSWNGIFNSDSELYYEVSAGTTGGGVNILQWQFTNQTSIAFEIPATVTTTAGLNVFLTVGAVSVGGESVIKTGRIILP